jgi:hypothetical protein
MVQSILHLLASSKEQVERTFVGHTVSFLLRQATASAELPLPE